VNVQAKEGKPRLAKVIIRACDQLQVRGHFAGQNIFSVLVIYSRTSSQAADYNLIGVRVLSEQRM
jgi:hypothetical protein